MENKSELQSQNGQTAMMWAAIFLGAPLAIIIPWLMFIIGPFLILPAIVLFLGFTAYLGIRSKMKKRALIVDDDPQAIRMMETMMKKLGVETISCQNPYEAINAMKTQDLSIVFVDQQMPEMTGVQMIQRADQECPEGANPEVVFVTGNPDEVQKEAHPLSHLRVGGVLSKNTGVNDLFKKVEKEVESIES